MLHPVALPQHLCDTRNAVPRAFGHAMYPGNTRCEFFRKEFCSTARPEPATDGNDLKRKPEVSLNQKVNQKIKNLIQQLGEAIHESVSESEQIAGVVKNIREHGFDVLLMLEATIGLNEVETESDSEGQPLLLGNGSPIDGPFTHNDMNFLKSLRISLPEDEMPEELPGARTP
jgi:hypothetical protein